MESDSIRASGSNTLIDIWVEGKLRGICVTREAVETFLGPKGPAAMTEDDRCEFVRNHLPQVIAAAQTSLRGQPAATTIVIEAGQLNPLGDARKGDRRKSERRKTPTVGGDLRHGERRGSERRNGDRRRSANKTDR